MMPIAIGVRRHHITTFDVVRSVVGGGGIRVVLYTVHWLWQMMGCRCLMSHDHDPWTVQHGWIGSSGKDLLVAKPLLLMRTVGSIDVKCRVKPLKHTILTKKCNRLQDPKGICLFRAPKNLRHIMTANAKKILGKSVTESLNWWITLFLFVVARWQLLVGHIFNLPSCVFLFIKSACLLPSQKERSLLSLDITGSALTRNQEISIYNFPPF
jgi:hypothetical protein